MTTRVTISLPAGNISYSSLPKVLSPGSGWWALDVVDHRLKPNASFFRRPLDGACRVTRDLGRCGCDHQKPYPSSNGTSAPRQTLRNQKALFTGL